MVLATSSSNPLGSWAGRSRGIWRLLTTDERFNDLGADYYLARRDPERETRRLVHKLEVLGHSVILTPTT